MDRLITIMILISILLTAKFYRISSLSTSADSNIVPFIRQDKSKADTKKDSKLKTSHAGCRHTTTGTTIFLLIRGENRKVYGQNVVVYGYIARYAR